MFLLKKHYALHEYQPTLVRIIPITSRVLLLVSQHSIALFDSVSQSVLQRCKPFKEDTTIFDCQYHAKTKQLKIIYYQINVQGIRNWLIGILKVKELQFGEIRKIWDFSQNPTKYLKMQLSPRILVFSNSCRWVLLRQFYNDSQCIVFQKDQQKYSFFINQEYLSCFDDERYLINKRSNFNNKLEMQIIDISDSSNKPIKKRYRIDVEGQGVFMFGKKIKGQQKMMMSINWKQKQSELSIFSLDENRFVHEQILKQQRLLHIFWSNSTYFAVLIYGKHRTFLKLFSIQNDTFNLKDQIDYQIRGQQFNSYLIEDESLIVNYSLPKQHEIPIQIVRVYQQKQAYTNIFDQYLKQQSGQLLQQIYSLLKQ